MATPLLQLDAPPYPEREEAPEPGWLQARADALGGALQRRWRAWGVRRGAVVARIRQHEAELDALDDAGLAEAARELGRALRRDGLQPALCARAFALAGCAAHRRLGKRPYDVQMLGGWIMLQGMVAEMNTGEGKTLTATLPACAMALAGVPVHVITVNDYLVARDAELMRPVYEALGLRVGVVTEDLQPPERQAAYACPVVYASNKTVVFDYLRDRLVLAGQTDALRLRVDQLAGEGARTRRLLLRGLSYAIVDEADSVLVDEARTPLIISAPAGDGGEAELARQGMVLAAALVQDEDFRLALDTRIVHLTEAGRRSVARISAPWGGPWAGKLRREELAVQALTAQHLFHRDQHYLVRDDQVQIVDEYTGRVMADRSWERGLHQMIEAKEGCTVTAPKAPLARISYQRFFRRYLRLSGMTGTAEEVRGELGAVYGLPVVRVPTHRPSRRQIRPERVLRSADAKWQAIAQRVAELHARGAPVLLGTPSVAASERAAAALAARGLPYQLLSAKQDADEAAVVAAAGQPGRITIATNMAGRGTDIALAPEALALGGLHVILSERHDSGRIDRQLAGRCARQGDPGVFEAVLSLDDELLHQLGQRTPLARLATHLRRAAGDDAGPLAVWLIRLAQHRVEQAHSRVRQALLKSDRQVSRLLAFSGRPE
ncbi:prepilin peptidase [Ideonella sp. DXS22W]|uniref:Protein translocase subunit SecA n=1 Tax=Pseudaquabacterium inlustre TaxID=2984192 RepID=A0ABU9CQ26_9BURK